MRIAVLGGSGTLGVAVTARALAAGHSVVAVSRRAPLRVPVPGKTGAYLRSGKMCAPDRAVGKTTFAEWLREKYV